MLKPRSFYRERQTSPGRVNRTECPSGRRWSRTRSATTQRQDFIYYCSFTATKHIFLFCFLNDMLVRRLTRMSWSAAPDTISLQSVETQTDKMLSSCCRLRNPSTESPSMLKSLRVPSLPAETETVTQEHLQDETFLWFIPASRTFSSSVTESKEGSRGNSTTVCLPALETCKHIKDSHQNLWSARFPLTPSTVNRDVGERSDLEEEPFFRNHQHFSSLWQQHTVHQSHASPRGFQLRLHSLSPVNRMRNSHQTRVRQRDHRVLQNSQNHLSVVTGAAAEELGSVQRPHLHL